MIMTHSKLTDRSCVQLFITHAHGQNIDVLTLSDKTKMVFKCTSLHNGSNCSGLFYVIVKKRHFDKTDVRYSVSSGYGLLRVYITKINMKRNGDQGNQLLIAGVQFIYLISV